MVEAAIPLLETLGVEDKRVYYDKFTTTGEPYMNSPFLPSGPSASTPDIKKGEFK